MKIAIPHFTEIDTSTLEEYYSAEIQHEGKTIKMDLNFEHESIEPNKIDLVVGFLGDLKRIIENVKCYIDKDFKNGSDVDEFLQFQLEEQSEEDILKLLESTDKTKSKKERLLSVVTLRRIGIYPDDLNVCGIFDFGMPDEENNYLLVVKVRQNGQLNHITMES